MFKEAPNDFFIDDNEIIPTLSLDKDIEFPINLPFLKRIEVTDSKHFYSVSSLPVSMC